MTAYDLMKLLRLHSNVTVRLEQQDAPYKTEVPTPNFIQRPLTLQIEIRPAASGERSWDQVYIEGRCFGNRTGGRLGLLNIYTHMAARHFGLALPVKFDSVTDKVFWKDAEAVMRKLYEDHDEDRSS